MNQQTSGAFEVHFRHSKLDGPRAVVVVVASAGAVVIVLAERRLRPQLRLARTDLRRPNGGRARAADRLVGRKAIQAVRDRLTRTYHQQTLAHPRENIHSGAALNGVIMLTTLHANCISSETPTAQLDASTCCERALVLECSLGGARARNGNSDGRTKTNR